MQIENAPHQARTAWHWFQKFLAATAVAAGVFVVSPFLIGWLPVSDTFRLVLVIALSTVAAWLVLRSTQRSTPRT